MKHIIIMTKSWENKNETDSRHISTYFDIVHSQELQKLLLLLL